MCFTIFYKEKTISKAIVQTSGIFSIYFYFRKIGQENKFHNILKSKNAFLHNKDKMLKKLKI